MSRLSSKFTFLFSRLASFLVASLAFSVSFPVSAQGVGADFTGGVAKLEAGALVVYALLAVLLVMSFAIAIAHYVQRRAFDDSTNSEPEDWK